MSVRRPVIKVIGPAGRDLVPIWGNDLVHVQIVDAAGRESDACTLTFRDVPPNWKEPPKGTKFTVYLGWDTNTLTMMGTYTSQRSSFHVDPDSGGEMAVICRAADMIDKLKDVSSGHYDGKTVKEIVEDMAAGMGVEASVSADIASIVVPYRLRFKQSSGDFLSRLADDVGAIIKPQAGKLVALKRGAGMSAGGKALPEIELTYDPMFAFDADVEPRASYGKIRAGWIDPRTGMRTSKSSAGEGAGTGEIIHPYGSEEELDAGLAAATDEQARRSATATFNAPGDARALAEAPVKAKGYGATIDATPWIADTVTHEVDPGQGWTMAIECSVGGKKKTGKGKGNDVINDPESEW
jgi:phage protein D